MPEETSNRRPLAVALLAGVLAVTILAALFIGHLHGRATETPAEAG